MSAPDPVFANPHRGEVLLTLGQSQYRLRPSFQALAEAEETTGSLIALIERAGQGKIMIADIAALLHACAKAGGHDVRFEVFSEEILRAGLAAVAVPTQQLLKAIMGGDGDARE
ncbi:MAG: gene transfer agent family protein [Pseudomonadota bacterium]